LIRPRKLMINERKNIMAVEQHIKGTGNV